MTQKSDRQLEAEALAESLADLTDTASHPLVIEMAVAMLTSETAINLAMLRKEDLPYNDRVNNVLESIGEAVNELVLHNIEAATLHDSAVRTLSPINDSTH